MTVYAAREVGTAIIAEELRKAHGRIEPVERISIQPRGSSFSRTQFARGTCSKKAGSNFFVTYIATLALLGGVNKHSHIASATLHFHSYDKTSETHFYCCNTSGSDEDYQIMTRGKLLDRIKVELAGGIAVRVAIGEETNFNLPGQSGSASCLVTQNQLIVLSAQYFPPDMHVCPSISYRCEAGYLFGQQVCAILQLL